MASGDERVFCSTIIPTIGRSTLDRAVRSVLGQTLTSEDYEVIVVNDSGEGLPESEWSADDRVRILHTERHERSVARNTGAAVALGDYLHFLDDDDWLLPRAMERFQAMIALGDMAFLYGTAELIPSGDRVPVKLNLAISGNCFCEVMAGEWIPLPAFVVAREAFWEVGGFDPLLPVGQDIDLCRRIALREDFVCLFEPVARILRDESWKSSTDQALAKECSHQGVERILDQPDALRRMLSSARSPYWLGHVVRTYLGSILWNLRQGQVLMAGSRFLLAGVSGLYSGFHVLKPAFWRGVLLAHQSNVLLEDGR